MVRAAYNWIGLGLGVLLALGGLDDMLLSLGDTPRNYGDAAFGAGFAIFWAGVAVGSGYGLVHSRRLEASGGCLTIVAILGGLVVLSGGVIAAAGATTGEGVDRLVVGLAVAIGASMLIPSALLLWHRRDPGPAAAAVRRWQGVVVGGVIVSLGAVIFLATIGDPYDIGSTGHAVVGAVILAGAALIGVSAWLIVRARGSQPAAQRP